MALAIGRENSDLGEGLPKVCFRRKSRFGHLRRHFSSVCGSSSHVGSVSRSSKWSYAWRSGVCHDRRWSWRTASVRLEAAMQSDFQEKFSCTMAVRGLLDGGSVMVRRMRTFAAASETGART